MLFLTLCCFHFKMLVMDVSGMVMSLSSNKLKVRHKNIYYVACNPVARKRMSWGISTIFLLLLMGVAVTGRSVSLQAPTFDVSEMSWWPDTVCYWRYCVYGRYPGWDFSMKSFCKKHMLHWNVFACIEILFFKTEFDLSRSWPTWSKLARIWVGVLTRWIHGFSSNLSCSLIFFP